MGVTMGLDAWIYEVGSENEIYYRRNHREMNRHMFGLYCKQNPQEWQGDEFDGGKLYLTENDIDEILLFIRQEEFDCDYYDEEEKSDDESEEDFIV